MKREREWESEREIERAGETIFYKQNLNVTNNVIAKRAFATKRSA
jgi:hypothetical protein